MSNYPFFVFDFNTKMQMGNLEECEIELTKGSDLWKSGRDNREVRRKLRIARKLHELEEDILTTAHQVRS